MYISHKISEFKTHKKILYLHKLSSIFIWDNFIFWAKTMQNLFFRENQNCS